MPYELGVDLGTTFTAAAVRVDGVPSMVGLGNRALQIPSVLFRTDAGFLVGETAERRGAAEPRRIVREFKRRLGDPVPVLVDGAPYSAEALTATLLRWVVDATTRRQGEPPAGLVLTHPASWGDYKLDVLRQVLVLAEVGPARWCPEPVAAAAEYASRARVPVGERIGVYDLGGGTFDACVLQKTPDGFAMLGPAEGVEHLGGVDVDEAVFEHVRTLLGDRLDAVDLDDPETTTGLARLRRECVAAKEELSGETETTVRVALPGLLTSLRVTRADLEQLIGPAVEQTVSAMGRAIRAARLEPTDLSAIVLVGGSSRIPLVSETLERRFDVPVALDTHPKHDVALGSLRTGTTASPTTAAVPTEAAAAAGAPAPARVAPDASRKKTGRQAPVPGTDQQPSPAASARQVPPPPFATPPPGSGPPSGGPVEELAVGDGGTDQPGTPARRTRLLVAAALLAVLVVAAVVVVPRLLEGSAAVPSAGGSVPTTTEPTPSIPPSATPSIALPQSDPLPADQLLVSIVQDGNTDLYVASASSGAAGRRTTTSAAVDAFPVLSPDRRTVIYQRISADGTRALRVAGAADGSGDRPLVSKVPDVCASRMGRPAWNPAAPDVLAVVCVSRTGTVGLYLVKTDGALVSRIPLPGLSVGDPTFSVDGSRLAFWSATRADWNAGDIYVVAADGSGSPVRLTTSTRPTQYADPAFSPDGLSVAYRRRDAGATPDGDAHVYVVNADGSGTPEPLAVTPGANEQDPTYSPGGDQIAYMSDRQPPGVSGQRTARVWVMSSDGHDQHVLLADHLDDAQTSVSWTHR